MVRAMKGQRRDLDFVQSVTFLPFLQSVTCGSSIPGAGRLPPLSTKSFIINYLKILTRAGSPPKSDKAKLDQRQMIKVFAKEPASNDAEIIVVSMNSMIISI